MDFGLFSQQLSKIKDLPLPGEASHLKMIPEFRLSMNLEEKAVAKNPKKAGVMALFYPDERKTSHLLLILRKTYIGVHSNQVGFPGGKMEGSDISIEQTALRETHEEVGVPPEAIKIIKSLTQVYIPPSNFEVQPFVGLLTEPFSFVPEVAEVEALIEVPLQDFMNDAMVSTQRLSTSYALKVDVPVFKLKGYTVWGATAMMLSEIKVLLRQVL
ncbi:MAG: CoA pyrophosphatase [Flavobacteriaceae bacterium]